MLVARQKSTDPSVRTLERTHLATLAASTWRKVLAQERRSLWTENRVLHSTARAPTPVLTQIEELDPDVVILHWLGNSTASIAQVGRLLAGPRPVAWVLHDTWAFCGAEHYPNGPDDQRFVTGYRRENRPRRERGPDINRHTWERKRRHWTRPAHIVAPSKWMAQEARRSALIPEWPIQVIPNPLDTSWWGALTRAEARARLGIAAADRVVLFGAIGGEADPRKGADLLRAALPAVADQLGGDNHRPIRFVTFGGSSDQSTRDGITVRSVGQLDDIGLRLHYAAADVMVVPSRQDNLPQTAVEPTAAGTPVVAFDIGGLPDIVEDGITGRLVKPFDTAGLAEAIAWVVEDDDRNRRLGAAAAARAKRWHLDVVGAQYAGLLSSLRSKRQDSDEHR